VPNRLPGILISHPHAAPFAVGLATAVQAEGKLAELDTGLAIPAAGALGRLGQGAVGRYPLLRNRIIAAQPLSSPAVVAAGACAAGAAAPPQAASASATADKTIGIRIIRGPSPSVESLAHGTPFA